MFRVFYAFLLFIPFSPLIGFSQCIIDTDQGPIKFNIEIAKTPSKLAQGLMFREKLEEDSGMLFDFGELRPISMWMKNTLFSLDMIFVNNQGKIIKIFEQTTPYSLKPLGPITASAVLEVNAGLCQTNGITVGQEIKCSKASSHPKK